MRSVAVLLLASLLGIVVAQNVGISKNELELATDLQWVGNNYVYGLAPNGSVYESSDSGKAFRFIPGISRVITVYPVPGKVGEVFLLGHWDTNISYWVKSGVTTSVKLGRYFNQIKINQADPSQMLGSDKLGGVAFFDLYYISNANTANANNKLIRTKAYDYHHCFAGLGTVPAGRLCVIADLDRGGQQRLLRSNDFGNTWTTVIDQEIKSFTPHWSFIFATDAESRLWVSSDNATSFKAAIFPNNNRLIEIQPEQIISARPNSVFIAGHTGSWSYLTPRPGTVYASDNDGLQYTVVGDNVNSLNNWWDFAPIRSLEGFYIMNILMQWEDYTYVRPDGSVMAKTVITDSNAGNWTWLRAPVGSDCNISSWDCTLNLFGLTTWLGVGGGFYGSIYSNQDSVGLIIGTGNVGRYLNMSRDAIYTYLSYDGGYNWKQIFNFPTVYAHSANAGVIVFVQNQVPIKDIFFSIDGGLSVRSVLLDEGKEYVCSSVNNPYGDKYFVVKCGGPTYFVLDFTGFNPSICKSDQMEDFKPDNGVCILGRVTMYNRRKQTAECALPSPYNPIVSATTCQCQRWDYECDMGYARTYGSQTCALVDSTQLDPVAAGLCTGNTYYTKSKGYRKIAGNQCTGTIPGYETSQELCPVSSILFPEGGMSKGGIVGLMFVFIILVGIGAFIGGIVAGHRSHHIRQRVPKAWISVENTRLL